MKKKTKKLTRSTRCKLIHALFFSVPEYDAADNDGQPDGVYSKLFIRRVVRGGEELLSGLLQYRFNYSSEFVCSPS